jgi:hypothetical protein
MDRMNSLPASFAWTRLMTFSALVLPRSALPNNSQYDRKDGRAQQTRLDLAVPHWT